MKHLYRRILWMFGIASYLALPLHALEWQPLNDVGYFKGRKIDRTFAISGIAFAGKDDNGRTFFLVVHDNKRLPLTEHKDEAGRVLLCTQDSAVRVAVVTFNGEKLTEYKPLTWRNKNEEDKTLPSDLEALSPVPDKPNNFLAVQSDGTVYQIILDDLKTSVTVTAQGALAHDGVAIKGVLGGKAAGQVEIEGFHLQKVGNILLAVWGQRGDNKPSTLFWSVQDGTGAFPIVNRVENLTVAWPKPESGKDLRHISDLRVSSTGTLYIAAGTETNAPHFTSAIYEAGTFAPLNGVLTLNLKGTGEGKTVLPEDARLFVYDEKVDHRVEGMEQLPDTNQWIFATDDEGKGTALLLVK